MTETVFSKVDYTLGSLMDAVELGVIGLPDIQRPFVWKNAKVRNLFDSMYRGYPVGYLLFWENASADRVRDIGANRKQKIPNLLIVDGQQRLTSLYAVVKGLPVVRENYETEHIEIAFNPLTEIFEVADAAIRRDKAYIPNISAIWARNTDIFELADSYLEGLATTREVSAEEKKQVRKAITRIQNLTGFPFTSLSLSSSIDEEQVAEVFVRINSEGKKLNPPPPKRARRRVETPPGAQAQADWAIFSDVIVAGECVTLHSFHMLLSHSRGEAIVWERREDQLSWLSAHNGAFTRLGGIPAVVRVDNTKTAVAQGAGVWGRLNESYRRYAVTVRFHVDVCAPYSPEHKGKVERSVRSQRWRFDPGERPWDDLAELQAASDLEVENGARRRRCPATGTSVWEAWQEERRVLAPLPILPTPFDHVATRRVADDALICFEGRQYSVPFAFLGREVEVRGGAGRVQILADRAVVAEHPRQTARRLVIDPAHYDGEATTRVLPPTPLGRLGRRLQELACLPVERRPVDLYAALAEVAR